MSWSTRTFFTGSADSVEEAVTNGLAGFAVGERLERLDRMRPCIEWWTLPVRGGMLDEVVHVTAVRVHPGDRVPLRSAEWSIRLARSITAHSGGFGGVLVQDRALGRFGRGLLYSGRVVEAAVGGTHGVRLDLGRPPGVDDAAREASLTEPGNQAVWVDWLEQVTGLTTFDIDQARVRRPPRRNLVALVPDGLVSDGWEPGPVAPRTTAALFVDPATWDELSPLLSDRWMGRLRLTPPRVGMDSFKPQTMSYALIQADGHMDLDLLDSLARRARCDATAVEVSGEGRPIRWWDWEKGAPAHAGEVLGGSDFVEVWGALAVQLDTNPHVFTCPWQSEPQSI